MQTMIRNAEAGRGISPVRQQVAGRIGELKKDRELQRKFPGSLITEPKSAMGLGLIPNDTRNPEILAKSKYAFTYMKQSEKSYVHVTTPEGETQEQLRKDIGYEAVKLTLEQPQTKIVLKKIANPTDSTVTTYEIVPREELVQKNDY